MAVVVEEIVEQKQDERTSLLWQISRQAGSRVRKFFGTDLEIQNKGDVDLVTEADHDVERFLVTQILDHFPNDGILTEEGRNHISDNAFRWIIDPLDGTTNFAHGLPHFATSIALEEDGALVAGVVYDAVKGEFFHAQPGPCSLGAFSVFKRN